MLFSFHEINIPTRPSPTKPSDFRAGRHREEITLAVNAFRSEQIARYNSLDRPDWVYRGWEKYVSKGLSESLYETNKNELWTDMVSGSCDIRLVWKPHGDKGVDLSGSTVERYRRLHESCWSIWKPCWLLLSSSSALCNSAWGLLLWLSTAVVHKNLLRFQRHLQKALDEKIYCRSLEIICLLRIWSEALAWCSLAWECISSVL